MQVLITSPALYVALVSFPKALYLSFPICKMGTITATEDPVWRCICNAQPRAWPWGSSVDSAGYGSHGISERGLSGPVTSMLRKLDLSPDGQGKSLLFPRGI